MRKKWIGPPNPGPDGQEQGHQVTIAGHDFGVVRPGEVLEVPDELVKKTKDWPGVVWPEGLWEDAPAETKQQKKGDA